MAEYIDFIELPRNPGAVTWQWKVVNKQNGSVVGGIKWENGWRCYCFHPSFPTIFEHVCLEDIASFLKKNTQEQKDMATLRRKTGLAG